MAERIHIIGTSPRSGTTLMMQLMVHCFEIDRFCDHEMSIFDLPRGAYKLFCSKKPREILETRALLAIDRRLWVICMVRDPRDVVVSRHQKRPGIYWTTLDICKKHVRLAERMAGHPRFLIVRYEHLVRNPNHWQDVIAENMPFLKKKADFTAFHTIAKPHKPANLALGGVRPINTSSIGRWRSHKPRLVAQLGLHGGIADDLIRLEYERNNQWLKELEGVEPDNGQSYLPDRVSWTDRARTRIDRYVNVGLYALRRLKTREGDGSQARAR